MALIAPEVNTSLRLSPDGAVIGFVQTSDSGDAVWLAGRSGRPRLAALHDGRTIRDLSWTRDSKHLIYRHALNGHEMWSLSVYDTGTGRSTILCAGPVIDYWVSEADLVCSMRVPASKLSQLRRIPLGGQDPALVPHGEANPGYHRWLVDHQLRVRGGVRVLSDGSARIVVRAMSGSITTELEIPADARADLAVLGFSTDDRTLYLLTSAGMPTRGLADVDTETGAVATVFRHDHFDIGSYPIGPDGAWFEPVTQTPDLCSVFGQRLHQIPLTASMAARKRMLDSALAGQPVILDRSADDSIWLVGVVRDDGPLHYYRYTTGASDAELLFVNRPDLLPESPLPRLEPFLYQAADGCPIRGYRLAPRTAPAAAPTVVMVHGGPAARDIWRFHADAQFMAAVGFASLHLNYRGSRGRGKAFRLAGHGEWGRRMQDDLYDGVAVGIERGLIDPDAVGFFGGSYGGYAALLAATTRPDLVRYAIAISPQCDLAQLAMKPAPFWEPIAGSLRQQMLGDASQQELDQLLRDRSPRHRLTADCPSILIAHGARDPRIPIGEVDEFVDAARALGVSVTYLRFSDEGHLIKSRKNRDRLFIEIGSFLERHVKTR